MTGVRALTGREDEVGEGGLGSSCSKRSWRTGGTSAWFCPFREQDDFRSFAQAPDPDPASDADHHPCLLTLTFTVTLCLPLSDAVIHSSASLNKVAVVAEDCAHVNPSRRSRSREPVTQKWQSGYSGSRRGALFSDLLA